MWENVGFRREPRFLFWWVLGIFEIWVRVQGRFLVVVVMLEDKESEKGKKRGFACLLLVFLLASFFVYGGIFLVSWRHGLLLLVLLLVLVLVLVLVLGFLLSFYSSIEKNMQTLILVKQTIKIS